MCGLADLPEQYRACQLAISKAISRMSASYQQALLTLQRKRTGGNQQVTVKHIHQQVNVTQGGQAVVAGDKVMSERDARRAAGSQGRTVARAGGNTCAPLSAHYGSASKLTRASADFRNLVAPSR